MEDVTNHQPMARTGESALADAWRRSCLGDGGDGWPFSFVYDGKPSGELLANWEVTRESVAGTDGTELTRVICRDPVSGLECVLEMTAFTGSSALEWIVRFRNTGSGDTAIISDIQAMNVTRDCSVKTRPNLYYSKGTSGAIDDFALMQKEITHWQPPFTLESYGSRGALPFFNVELGEEGVIGGIGWTGNWRASFSRDQDGVVRVAAGMTGTHFRLHAGEEVTSPRVLLIFWKDDRVRAHNLLRRHMVARHLPRADGRVAEPPVCCATWGGMKTKNHLALIDLIRKNKLPFDVYWMDAGWYGPDHETEEFQNFRTEDWAYHRGHWRVNRVVHPDGLTPIASAASEAGMKVLLWFSPYTAEESVPLTAEHPEWTMGPWSAAKGIGLNRTPAVFFSLNLGIAELRRYLADSMSALIAEHKVEWFRDDGGLPLPKEEDEPADRKGIGEIRAVQGFYAFWDELLKRHPGLMIDNCGGGGTRIDLETMGRSLVLHRTDYNCHPEADPIGMQIGTHGLSHWAPLVGGGAPARPGDTYNFRSAWCGGIPFGLFHPCGLDSAPTAPAPDYPIEWHRRMIEDYQRVRKYYTGDFYPLTGCSTSDKEWFAYQMDRPDLGEGVVVVLRRPKSPFERASFCLQGLDGAQYEVTDLDSGVKRKISGSSLAAEGLPVEIGERPGSVVVVYIRL
ncbi:alpha-galactosidase [Verrucomicrobiota bacterium]